MSIPIISFYSYKGGSGRTTTTVNAVRSIAKQLNASKEKPLLVVDLDLESAGLTYFFNLQNKFYTGTKSNPLTSVNVTKILQSVDYLSNSLYKDMIFEPEQTDVEKIDPKLINSLNEISKEFNLNVDVLRDVEISVDQIRLLRELSDLYLKEKHEFLKHRKFNFRNFIESIYQHKNNPQMVIKVIDEYMPLTTFADISKFYNLEEGSVKLLGMDDNISISVNPNAAVSSLLELKGLCNDHNYCGIICDSSSGRQSTADALHKVSNLLIYCMRPTSQFRIGTSNNLAYYRESIIKLHEKKIPLRTKIILLPTAVPALKSQFTDAIFNEINTLIVNTNKEFVDGHFCTHDKALCEVNRFKWEESILKFSNDMTEDESRAYKTYDELGEKVITMLNEAL